MTWWTKNWYKLLMLVILAVYPLQPWVVIIPNMTEGIRNVAGTMDEWLAGVLATFVFMWMVKRR